MASAGKKWAIGCGIGCGFILLLVGGVGTCGYFGVRKIVDQADGIEESFDELDARFGHARDYVPDVDGRIPPERIEVYLAVREAMVPSSRRTADLMAQLSDDSNIPGPRKVLAKIRAGVSFIPAMMVFIEERNTTLLDKGMGLGEYHYIYALAFFSQLEKDPADGPSFRVSGSDDEEDQEGPIRWGVHTGDGASGDVREDREKEIRRYLNKSLGLIAHNQLDALDQRLAGLEDQSLKLWREALAAEVAAMDREPRRILWEEGLPPVLLDSLEPFRDRLETSYVEILNVVELGLVTHQ